VRDILYGDAVCAHGSIINDLPVLVGSYAQGNTSLEGLEDEIRISNYAKRDFEVSASARPYSAYTQALGKEVASRNSTSSDSFSYDPFGHKITVERHTRLMVPADYPW